MRPLAPFIVVSDLVEAKRRLIAAGMSSSIRKEWEDDERKYILVSDPDGNLLEIIRPKQTGG
jgi:hypothetical protein